MALTALDQEEPNVSRPAGRMHVFAWKTGDYALSCRCKNWLSMLKAFVMFAECSFAETFVSRIQANRLKRLDCGWKNRSAADEQICAFVWLSMLTVKAQKSSCSHCGCSGMALRRRGLQHLNRSGLKHDTGRHRKGKRQRKAKQGCHNNYQWHVLRGWCLTIRRGHVVHVWLRLLNFLHWYLKCHAVLLEHKFLTVLLRLLSSLIIVITLKR